MPDYSKGKIYRIVCNTSGLVYYGSTSQPYLSKRLRNHVEEYNKYKNGLKHSGITSIKILENQNYEIVLVENYPCQSKEELHKRERFYIENNECVNKCIPTRTAKEYKTDNRDKIIQQMKEYDLKNKDRAKEYKQLNKNKIKEAMKIYYEKRKDKIKTYHKEYYIAKGKKLLQQEEKINETNIIVEPVEPKELNPKYKAQRIYQLKNKEKIYEQRRRHMKQQQMNTAVNY